MPRTRIASKCLFLFVIFLFKSVFTLSLWAQGALEEVIVTAQKRAESLQDVPVSVTAFTGDAIEQLGYTDSNDIIAQTPNLQWSRVMGNTGTSLYLRGIGDPQFLSNIVPSVGIYLDDVYRGSNLSNVFALFDTERIEILRGPQNALYGRNTTGGAINVISRTPNVDDGINGKIKVSYGRFDQGDIQAAFGAPLSKTLAVRASGTFRSRSNWAENSISGQDLGGYRNYHGRILLSWDPNEQFDALFNIHASDNKADPAIRKSIGLYEPATFNPLLGPFNALCSQAPALGNGCLDAAGLTDNTGINQSTGNDLANMEDKTFGLSLKMNWHFENFTLTSITAYDEADASYVADADSGPARLFEFHYETEGQSQLSQEIRFTSTDDSRLQWIAGAFYLKENLNHTPALAIFMPPPTPPLGLSRLSGQDIETWSIFGQGSYDINDHLKFTLGLRYNEENKTGRLTQLLFAVPLSYGRDVFDHAFVQNNTLVPTAVDIYDHTWKEWGGRVALDYQLSDDVLVYGSVSRGFKGGNVDVSPGRPATILEPEILVTYELGAKTEWFDGRMQLNGAFFYNDFEDQQISILIPAPGGGLTQSVANADKARVYGIEVESRIVPADGWFISMGLGWLDAKFKRFIDATGTDLSGNKMAFAPDINFNGLVRYELPIGNGVLGLQTDFTYNDEIFSDVANNPFGFVDSYWLFNASASYRFGTNETYELTIWGRNIGDEQFFTSCIPGGTLVGSVCAISEPATYGVSLSVDFE